MMKYRIVIFCIAFIAGAAGCDAYYKAFGVQHDEPPVCDGPSCAGDGGTDARDGAAPDLLMDLSMPDFAPMCTTSHPCTDPKLAICDGAPAMCRPCAGSADDSGCKALSAATPRCVNHVCVQCRDSMDCGGTTAV